MSILLPYTLVSLALDFSQMVLAVWKHLKMGNVIILNNSHYCNFSKKSLWECSGSGPTGTYWRLPRWSGPEIWRAAYTYTQQHINLPLYVPLPSFNFALLLKSMWLGSTEHAAEHSFHFCHQIAPLFNNKFLLTFLAGAGTPGAKRKIQSIYDAWDICTSNLIPCFATSVQPFCQKSVTCPFWPFINYI